MDDTCDVLAEVLEAITAVVEPRKDGGGGGDIEGVHIRDVCTLAGNVAAMKAGLWAGLWAWLISFRSCWPYWPFSAARHAIHPMIADENVTAEDVYGVRLKCEQLVFRLVQAAHKVDTELARAKLEDQKTLWKW
jgi:hypothetical protein